MGPSVIVEVSGDLLESGCDGLVNAVNCVGVMGKGVALEFRRRFPEMFRDYKARCARRELLPGHPYLWRDTNCSVISFPTKNDWRAPSQLSWVAAGLPRLVEIVQQEQLQSLAVPALGCGLGGLAWDDVKPLLHDHLGRLPIRVELYLPR